jgi:hypothetical protein
MAPRTATLQFAAVSRAMVSGHSPVACSGASSALHLKTGSHACTAFSTALPSLAVMNTLTGSPLDPSSTASMSQRHAFACVGHQRGCDVVLCFVADIAFGFTNTVHGKRRTNQPLTFNCIHMQACGAGSDRERSSETLPSTPAAPVKLPLGAGFAVLPFAGAFSTSEPLLSPTAVRTSP